MNKHRGKAAVSLLQPAQDPRFAFEPLLWRGPCSSHTSSEDLSLLAEMLKFLLKQTPALRLLAVKVNILCSSTLES